MGKARTGPEAVERIREFFRDRPEFALVLVYGSAARGSLGDESDVDVAVAGERPLDSELLMDAVNALTGLLGRDVDLIDLHRVEGLILHRAVTGGLRVKTDPELFVKFHGKALTYREDFQELQRAMRNARIRRFIDGS